MRGKVSDDLRRNVRIRITPAYAGKRRDSLPVCFFLKDHPRLCGEKSRSPLWLGTKIGSPPPMRGKGNVLREDLPHVGITPAYAGKSPHARGQTCHVQDHPRLCGEKVFPAVQPTQISGSPPPMRGKVISSDVAKRYAGITPAYAGKSAISLRCRCLWWDHPRLCGEKFQIVQRGKVGLGITPAYAGKSLFVYNLLPEFGDHPRLCGEKTKKIPKQRYFFHQPASFSFSLQYT